MDTDRVRTQMSHDTQNKRRYHCFGPSCPCESFLQAEPSVRCACGHAPSNHSLTPRSQANNLGEVDPNQPFSYAPIPVGRQPSQHTSGIEPTNFATPQDSCENGGQGHNCSPQDQFYSPSNFVQAPNNYPPQAYRDDSTPVGVPNFDDFPPQQDHCYGNDANPPTWAQPSNAYPTQDPSPHGNGVQPPNMPQGPRHGNVPPVNVNSPHNAQPNMPPPHFGNGPPVNASPAQMHHYPPTNPQNGHPMLNAPPSMNQGGAGHFPHPQFQAPHPAYDQPMPAAHFNPSPPSIPYNHFQPPHDPHAWLNGSFAAPNGYGHPPVGFDQFYGSFPPNFGQPMSGMPFGQSMNGMPFGQPMSGMPFGQPMSGMPFGQPMNGMPFGPMSGMPFGQPMSGHSQGGNPSGTFTLDAEGNERSSCKCGNCTHYLRKPNGSDCINCFCRASNHPLVRPFSHPPS